MALTSKQESRVKEMPIIETRINKSKDGKYLLHRTVITTIRPMAYYKAVFEDEASVDAVTEEDMKRFLEA